MSFVANRTQQVGLNDRFNNLTEREQKVVLGSWAKPFSEIIFPSIREEDFAVLYSDNKATRPNTPINIVIGAMIIKEIVGMSDVEVLEKLVVRHTHAVRATHDQYARAADERPNAEPVQAAAVRVRDADRHRSDETGANGAGGQHSQVHGSPAIP